MTHIAQGATGAILTHYQAVIEGSATLRGVPGSESPEAILRSGLTLTASSGSTTTMAPSSPSTAVVNKSWAPTNEPAYWLLCLTATESTNVGAARKISAWDGTTFTVQLAFPATVTAADTFTIVQGFRRIPNGIDLITVPDGWDRFFQLYLGPGKALTWYGKGLRSYESALEIRLRLLKHGRENDARKSVLENLRILRDGVIKSVNLESTYTRAIFEDGDAEIDEEDAAKVIGRIAMRLHYRVDLTYN